MYTEQRIAEGSKLTKLQLLAEFRELENSEKEAFDKEAREVALISQIICQPRSPMSRDHHVICFYDGFQLNMRYCEELEAFIESLSPEEQLRARALYPKPTYLTKPLVDKKEKEKESKERSRARKRSKVKQFIEKNH